MIAYSFEIDGNAWTGNRIAFADSTSYSMSDAAALAAKYSAGSKHAVYYDPGRPNNCVLEKGAGWFHYLLLLLPAVFFFGGAWIVWDNGREIWRRLTGAKRVELEGNGRAQ